MLDRFMISDLVTAIFSIAAAVAFVVGIIHTIRAAATSSKQRSSTTASNPRTEDGTYDPRPTAAPHPSLNRWFTRRVRRDLVIRIAVAGVCGLFALGREYTIDRWFPTQELIVSSEKQQEIQLADHSIVHANTNSHVKTEFNPLARNVALPRGEARFTVHKDHSRPFAVRTPQLTAIAHGTVFNVRTLSELNATELVVISGRVEAMSPSAEGLFSNFFPGAWSWRREPRWILGPGDSIVMTSNGVLARDAASRAHAHARAGAWPKNDLAFRAEPLSTAIAEFNRFYDAKARVDPKLSDLSLYVTFNAYDRDSLFAYLTNYCDVTITKHPDGSLWLSKRKTSP